MSKQQLRRQLEQIKNEIDNTKNVDPKGKELLQRTRADIQDLLDQQDQSASIDHSETTSRLEETIAHLEDTHPHLSVLMTELLEVLSNAGI